MKRTITMMCTALFLVSLLAACIVAPGPPGYGPEEVPPLPAIIELNAEPYYYQSGYYYFYQNDSWRYSRSKNGPWLDLPRSHWPREIRQREREERREELRRGREHEHDER